MKVLQPDFICISEFSELLGPVVTELIPNVQNKNINLDDFVVRIQAADWQNRGSMELNESPDSQVILYDPSSDIYAYVHYFTLLDVHARGYVRPICLSYVTQERDKLYDHFLPLLDSFT